MGDNPEILRLFLLSICSASLAIVGKSKNNFNGISIFKLSRILEIICVPSKECPPTSKKLSLMPTFLISRTCTQILAIISSVGVLGAI